MVGTKDLIIRDYKSSDWPSVSQIYKSGIDTGIATFEREVPTQILWESSHHKRCRLVALLEDNVAGWIALSPVSSREVYRGVAEVSLYVDQNYRGKGVGQNLLGALIACSEKEGFWSLQSSIFSENLASLKLHKKAGFRKIGYKARIGKINGLWKDNTLMERRSTIIGI